MSLVTLGQKPAAEGLLGLLLECHERIRRFSRLALLVGERVDLPAAEVVDACARVDRYFTEALPLHVADEEQSLLPRLTGRAGVDAELGAMHAQHEEHGPLLAALLEATRAVRARPGDAALHEALRAAAARIVTVFEEHLVLEETRIFPAMARALTPAEELAVVAELRARRGSPQP